MTGGIDKILRSTGFAAPMAALVLLFAYTPVCTAHAILVRSIPEQEATVGSIPAKIELWFDDGILRIRASLRCPLVSAYSGPSLVVSNGCC